MILVASAVPELRTSWEGALEGFADIVAVGQFASLKESLALVAPRVLLLDFELPGLDGRRGIAALRRTGSTTKIIVLAKSASDELEIALFKLGVRGCARSDIEPQLLKRIVTAIEHGELWIRRAITPRLLDELSARCRDAERRETVPERFALLTERERQIVRHIGSGESNKQIARELCITERTVKAHLTGIFRKLGVADRVRLALRVASRPDYEDERLVTLRDA